MRLLGVLLLMLCVAMSTAMSIDNPERAVDKKIKEKNDNLDKYEVILRLLRKEIDEVELRKVLRGIHDSHDSELQDTRGGGKSGDADDDSHIHGARSAADFTTGYSDQPEETEHPRLLTTDGKREIEWTTTSLPNKADAKHTTAVDGETTTASEESRVTTAYASDSTSAPPPAVTTSRYPGCRIIENKEDSKEEEDGDGLDMDEMIAKGESLERQLRTLFHDLRSVGRCIPLNHSCGPDKECCKGLKCNAKTGSCQLDCVEPGDSCKENYFCCGNSTCVETSGGVDYTCLYQ